MKYFFTIIDCFTRWPEAIPLPDSTTETYARAFIHHWISRFRVPDDITSDRGPQFTSHLWSELNCLLGISASNMMAYHPQANELVERFHQQLKGSLKARLQGPRWMDELPLVLLGIRTAWQEGSDCSASELIYGTSLRIPAFLANSFPMSHGIYKCPPNFSRSCKTTCELPLHPQWSFTVVVQPTNLTTWHPLVMCTFVMMPTAAHCSTPMMARSRSLKYMRSTMCST